ncbi:recombinase family protein [Brevundimonas goettingensis]|uniref:Recombinase family protein n=1 Tax=Brevundimonas goettingensis TaxID=2774190 RepID=A0A975GV07_9CAUL|nr:recombinase family protein [Brevundimonas goettingensis]QTC90852.1 recombinase family protein [Brevundimonas goettingensis]QTC90868.1 recombinase family protein [Brevundimonas goettingensis]
MTGALVGYARTSSAEQRAGLEAQVAELQTAGATKVFQEHVSSVDAQRPQLRAALDWVRDGDTFIVTKPDRLARSVTDLLRIVEDLKARNVTLRIMSMGVDTSTATGVLILQVLGAVSQWEREIMLERQRAGIAKAKAEGRYRGRAPTARAKTPEVLRLKAEGQTVAQIAQSVGISRASVYRAFVEAGA